MAQKTKKPVKKATARSRIGEKVKKPIIIRGGQNSRVIRTHRPRGWSPEMPIYNFGMCERVLKVGEEGGSQVDMALACGVSRNAMKQWTKAHPEFASAFEYAMDLSQAYWENLGRRHIENRNFREKIWSKNMECRFRKDWTSSTRIDDEEGKPIVTRVERVIIRGDNKR